MDKTWIRLYRKTIDSQVFKNEGLLKVWVWCLLKATYKKRWVDIKAGKSIIEVELKPGQFVFGRKSASKKLGMPPSTVWKRMQKLKTMRNCDIDSDTNYSIVTILNWDTYQPEKINGDIDSDRQGTGKEQARNTNKKEKKEKKKDICPLDIVNKYHEILHTLQPVRFSKEGKILNQTLTKQLQARIKENDEFKTIDFWENLFKDILKMPFLMGKNNRNWKATLIWITGPINLGKILDGNYKQNNSNSNTPSWV